jgi:hypothetical protein
MPGLRAQGKQSTNVIPREPLFLTTYRNNVIGGLLKQPATSTATVGGSCGDTIDFDNTSDDECTFVSNGKTFVGRDSTDFYGNDMALMQTEDLTACVEQCAIEAGCMAVSWSNKSCYLKRVVGTGLYNVNVDGTYS